MAAGLMRVLKAMALLAVLLVGGLVALLIWMAGGLQSPRTFGVTPSEVPGAPAAVNTSTVTVMSWNIAWAFGAGSAGDGESPGLKSATDMNERLERIAGAVQTIGPDILLLQEVDFDAKRSYGVDQARLIAEKAGYRYVAPAVSWQVNYLAFPYWPPSAHWADIISGGAILSRHPIVRCRVELLKKPDAQPFWYRPFYLFRYLQRCDIRIGDQVAAVYNTHMEAFDQTNRVEHVKRLASVISDEMSPRVIFGGDFNTVPPESRLKSAFPDEAETDLSDDPTLGVVRDIPGLADVVTVADFAQRESELFTFPAAKPNRKLDYIFAGQAYDVVRAWVPAEVGDVSDHLPIVTQLRLR